MLNQVILVGRIVKDIEVKELENGKKVTTINIAIPRSYKNEEGMYDTDFIDCELWDSVATKTAEYCKKGDIVGVKGRIESEPNRIHVLAEKVTFLSSNKSTD